MTEPYGGAVRSCPTCDGSGWTMAADEFGDIQEHLPRCPDCDGGWVPVDTLTATIRCEVCKGVGWTEALDSAGVRATPRCGCERGQSPVPGSWAYPQPGDIVLLEMDEGPRQGAIDLIGADVVLIQWPNEAFATRFWRPDMRLVVDQPNTAGRIPGTQPPGANDD